MEINEYMKPSMDKLLKHTENCLHIQILIETLLKQDVWIKRTIWQIILHFNYNNYIFRTSFSSQIHVFSSRH